MNYTEVAVSILEDVSKQINSKRFREKYFPNNTTLFSRNRKMPLNQLISFLMKKSLSSYELRFEKWRDYIGLDDDFEISKQAISKSRIKLGWKMFYDFMKISVEKYLQQCSNKNSWNGYQIYAIDSSTLQIPTNKETLDYFGYFGSQYEQKLAGARISTCTDVMNGIILDAQIKPYKVAERELAMEHFNNLEAYIDKEKTIFIFDRGYPSYDFLGYMIDHQYKFVIRVKKGLSRLITPEEADGEVYRKCRSKMRTIRTVQVELEDGSTEYLITNLGITEVPPEQFKELYFLRWGVETKYHEVKSRMSMEAFSGNRVECIHQDFFITLFISNVSSLIKNEVDIKIQETKNKKREYQANRNFVTGTLNELMGKILMRKVEVLCSIKRIIKKCIKKRSSIRRNRKNERNKNLCRRKYSMNYKPLY